MDDLEFERPASPNKFLYAVTFTLIFFSVGAALITGFDLLERHQRSEMVRKSHQFANEQK